MISELSAVTPGRMRKSRGSLGLVEEAFRKQRAASAPTLFQKRDRAADPNAVHGLLADWNARYGRARFGHDGNQPSATSREEVSASPYGSWAELPGDSEALARQIDALKHRFFEMNQRWPNDADQDFIDAASELIRRHIAQARRRAFGVSGGGR